MQEKIINTSGIQTNYKIAGEGFPLLILHGWGRGIESFTEVQENLAQKGWQVIAVDLPGFGKTEEPKEVWGVNEYTNFVLEFAEKLRLKKWVLLGHSFGGQIAVNLVAKHPEKVEKLILVAPAAIRKEPGKREHIIRIFAKGANFFLALIPSNSLQSKVRTLFAMIIGRKDYLQARGVMRDVMRKVIREDVSFLFSQITSPTLLIWGDKDRAVPVENARIMKAQISHASLKIFKDVGHRINRDAPKKLSETILAFLEQ